MEAVAEYRPIPSFRAYRAGSDGSIWTCWKIDGSHGRDLSTEWRKKAQRVNRPGGYLTAWLYGDGRRRREFVHRLILEAFVGPCPDGMQACHINGDPVDNRPSNLRWDTPKNNCADKEKHGTGNKGVKHGMAKLNDEKISAIRAEYAKGIYSQYEIASEFLVSQSLVYQIVNRKIWQHVP